MDGIKSVGEFDEKDEFELPEQSTNASETIAEPKPKEDEKGEEVTTLSDEERDQFQSLLTIGKTTKSFDVLGHKVVLSSMTVSQELLVGIKTKQYRDTEGYGRAYQSAVVAATLQTVDGDQWYIPLSSTESDSYIFEEKLKKVHDLYPLVVSEIYKHYLDVEREFAELASKLGKLGG